MTRIVRGLGHRECLPARSPACDDADSHHIVIVIVMKQKATAVSVVPLSSCSIPWSARYIRNPGVAGAGRLVEMLTGWLIRVADVGFVTGEYFLC